MYKLIVLFFVLFNGIFTSAEPALDEEDAKEYAELQERAQGLITELGMKDLSFKQLADEIKKEVSYHYFGPIELRYISSVEDLDLEAIDILVFYLEAYKQVQFLKRFINLLEPYHDFAREVLFDELSRQIIESTPSYNLIYDLIDKYNNTSQVKEALQEELNKLRQIRI